MANQASVTAVLATRPEVVTGIRRAIAMALAATAETLVDKVARTDAEKAKKATAWNAYRDSFLSAAKQFPDATSREFKEAETILFTGKDSEARQAGLDSTGRVYVSRCRILWDAFKDIPANSTTATAAQKLLKDGVEPKDGESVDAFVTSNKKAKKVPEPNVAMIQAMKDGVEYVPQAAESGPRDWKQFIDSLSVEDFLALSEALEGTGEQEQKQQA